MNKGVKQGSASTILLIVLFVLLLSGSVAFGVWAYMGRQDYKNNVDTKIATAVEVAQQETESAKENEFLEREKQPTRVYRGPDTYGAVSFSYPKTWSIATANGNSQRNVDLTAHPLIIPGSGIDQDFSYALRVQVLGQPYEKSVKDYESEVKRGGLQSTAYRAPKVQSVIGTRFDGSFVRDKTGIVILLPVRDKTLKIWTETLDYKNDFEKIILDSLTFQP